MNTELLLTKSDVSEICKVSMGKVDDMMKQGLPYIKHCKTTRFRRLDLEQYLEQYIII